MIFKSGSTEIDDRQALLCGLRDVAKVAKTFGISAWPKLLASFATPKLSLEDALVV